MTECMNECITECMNECLRAAPGLTSTVPQ